MKQKKYQIVLVVLLSLFFLIAAIMTDLSQNEYEKNCIPVIIDSDGTRESILIIKSLFIEDMPDKKGELLIEWDLGELNGFLKEGDNVMVATNEQVITGVIKMVVNDNEKIPKYSIATNWCLFNTFDQSSGVTITAKINGPYHSYVYPISCLVEDAHSFMVKIASSRKKVWGKEYYVRYENIRINEMNDEKFSIKTLPVDGDIIVDSEGPLYEGAKVKIKEQR